MANALVRMSCILVLGCLTTAVWSAQQLRSPYQIVEQAPAADWRPLKQADSLYIELVNGTVVVEMFPQIAPMQAANFKTLVREGFYDGLTIYRVVDGFVAQGGDVDGQRETGQGKRRLPAEFEFRGQLPYRFKQVDHNNGFAAESGFMHGFPLGRDGDSQWLLHCPGAFALARDESPDSGGTEFYMVLGHAPRYLDRNVTAFGMVRYGMQHLQQLRRGRDSSGQLAPERRNAIHRIRVETEVPAGERIPLQLMKTDSASFDELVRSRASRPESWFVTRPGYVDVCGVPVPVRLEPGLTAE